MIAIDFIFFEQKERDVRKSDKCFLKKLINKVQ